VHPGTPGGKPGFHMGIGPDLSEVPRVNAAFAGFAQGNGVPEADVRRIQVALDELLTNSISYGRSREITVDGDVAQGWLTIILTDDGTPFDPFIQIAPDTTLSVDLRRIGGLGIHLVQQMMDDVSYDRRDDRNVVTLKRNLDGHHDSRAQ
jgi:serine/threonine-protein kinase RsbW